MTPACRLLASKGIAYSVHEYEHNPACINFSLEAATKLNLSVEQVFKLKKLHLAEIKDAERITGYLVGSISPVAQKKRLSTVIDRSAQTLACMYVSGGKRGLDIGISPQDLVQVVQGTFAVVVDEY